MAIKNVNDFINSAEYTASLKDEAVHKAWYYATKLVEEKFTSTNTQSTPPCPIANFHTILPKVHAKYCCECGVKL